MPQVRAGTIKAYAVTAKNRIASAPEVPTTDEAGLPGFYFSFWHAHLGAEGHAEGHRRQAQRRLTNALADPATRKKLIDLAQDIFPPDQQTPEALRTFQQAEIDKWWPIIKAANIKVQ